MAVGRRGCCKCTAYVQYYEIISTYTHILLYSAFIFYRFAFRELLRCKAAYDNIIYTYKFVEDFIKADIKLHSL
jgi:hypothetical protein